MKTDLLTGEEIELLYALERESWQPSVYFKAPPEAADKRRHETASKAAARIERMQQLSAKRPSTKITRDDLHQPKDYEAM